MLTPQERIGIEYGTKEDLLLSKDLPLDSVMFQINRKLYVCLSDHEFLSADYSGNCTVLAPMPVQSTNSSLSGVNSQLIAIGG